MTTDALILNDPRPLMERIHEWISKVDAKVHVEKVLLFGSTAKGTRREESDVDLIVVSTSFRGVNDLKRISTLLRLWSYVEELNIIAYTPEEFNEAKERFMVKKVLAYAVDLTPQKPQQS